MAQTGIVAYSFALRADEPNPCNVALAENVVRARNEVGACTVVVAQWEVARALERLGCPADVLVPPPDDGSYLDSEAVWRVANGVFRDRGITEVIPVAQPFLHLAKARRLLHADRFTSRRFRVHGVGFDHSAANLQWWTKGPVRLLTYAVLQQLTGLRGHLPVVRAHSR